MLLTLYTLCGLAVGFIIGYHYGFDTLAMRQHGKQLDFATWLRRRLLHGF